MGKVTITFFSSGMKAVLIGRHNLLPAQKLLIEKAGLEITEQIPQVPTSPQELAQFVKQLAEKGVKAIVVQALPLTLLAQLFNEAQKHGIAIFSFRMEAITVVESEEEAKRIVAEKPEARTYLKAPNDNKIRIVEVKALERIKAIRVETETVATP